MSEDTHFNKYGAFLMARGLVEQIEKSEASQLVPLKKALAETRAAVSETAPEGLEGIVL